VMIATVVIEIEKEINEFPRKWESL